MTSLVKTPQQITNARIAGKVVGKILKTLTHMLVVGNNGLILAQKAAAIIKENNCQPNFLHYQGFPSVICVSINEQMIHGIPNNYLFQEGDLVSIDVGCQYKGMHADAALTKIIGKGTIANQKLVASTLASLELVIQRLKAGKRIGDIGYWISNFIHQKGYYLTTDYGGHGIGKQLHEPPIILNIGQKNSGLLLKKNMLICVEPMVLMGDSATKVLADGWTVVNSNNQNSCHFEHTLLITETGVEVLTLF